MRGEQKFTPAWGARQSEKQELKIIPVALRQRLSQVIMRLLGRGVEEKCHQGKEKTRSLKARDASDRQHGAG
jgi:hypothetical protein